MNPIIQINDAALDYSCAPIAITIIYEDRATGIRAKRFSDLLATSLGNADYVLPACWRMELIDLPEIAEEIARDAAGSEVVILSLRGHVGLSMATREWIESWLAIAAGGPASLVALFDPERSLRSEAEGVRYYLRQASADAGVPFFAHCAFASADAAAIHLPISNEPSGKPKRRRHFQNRIVSFFPACAAA